MAEVLLKEAFAEAGLDVIVDSTGISDEEAGNPMDYRAAQVLAAHGIESKASHRARRTTAADLTNSDLIIPMTSGHAKALRRLAESNGLQADIRMMRSFDPESPQVNDAKHEYVLDVDDPWYGGAREFEECLAELQAAVPGVVEYVKGRVG